MKKIIIIILVFLIYSCNSVKKNAISQIENDFSIIKDSQKELVERYEKCLTLFSEKSKVADGSQRIYCDISLKNSEQLHKLNLLNTKYLIDNGYEIHLDAKNYNRIFYQYDIKEHLAGIIRYGLLYTNIVNVKDGIYSLKIPTDTIRTLDSLNSIVEFDEYAE